MADSYKKLFLVIEIKILSIISHQSVEITSMWTALVLAKRVIPVKTKTKKKKKFSEPTEKDCAS